MKKEEIELGIEKGVSGIYQIIFDDGERKPLIYIGEGQCILERWKGHIRDLKGGYHHNSYIQNVLNKHGWENFDFKVFEVMNGSTQKERVIREKFWIKKLKTFCRAKTYDGYGFNLNEGGGGAGCGADHIDAKPCEIDGVRYDWYGEAAEVYGISSGDVGRRINSTSLRFKDWLRVDYNGKVIPKECNATHLDKSEEDKYIREHKDEKGEHVGWEVSITFVVGKQKSVGYFKMDEKELARAYRDYWLEHPNKSAFVDIVGEHLKDIFYNENIYLIPNLDLTKGIYLNKKTNKYHSSIKINKKGYSLGIYTDPKEASKMHYFALYNYVLSGTLPLKGKDQYKLFLEAKENGSEHPIINNLFRGGNITKYEKFCLGHWKNGGKFEFESREMNTIFYNENIDLKPNLDLTKGYSFSKKENKYMSNIMINKKRYVLGYYTDTQEASKMYYFALYNYVLNGTLPLKGKAQYKLYLETKEKGSEHPIINHLFMGGDITEYEKFCLEHWNSGGNFEFESLQMDTLFYNENIDLMAKLDLTKGICFEKKANRYKSSIAINKKLYSLGRYTDPQEASRMYYFASYNYALDGKLPLKGKGQYKLYLETKEKGSEHPIINHLFEST